MVGESCASHCAVVSFQSVQYPIFLAVVAATFFVLAPGRRWILLLAASYGFYALWRVEFCLVLLASTLVDYFVGLRIPSASGLKRRLLLSASLAVNLGMLTFFRYLGPGLHAIAPLFPSSQAASAMAAFDVALPLGISFYTFQTLSYTIDLYRGKREPERHFGIFAVYVSFFPQLLAGPIERSTTLLPQLQGLQQRWSYQNTREGAVLILLGLFKKLVVADRLALWTEAIFASPADFSPEQHVLAGAAVFYRYYCDVSAYADIAIGSALIMGIRLSRNFNRPLAARSIRTFWLRWHITITKWFRDYLYIPLAKKLPSALRPLTALVVFTLIGLWHGAAWQWLTFGAAHGLAYTGLDLTRRARSRIGEQLLGFSGLYLPRNAFVAIASGAKLVSVWAFLAVSCVLVASQSPEDAAVVYRGMLDASLTSFSLSAITAGTPLGRFQLCLLIFGVVAVELLEWLRSTQPESRWTEAFPTWWRIGLALGLLFGVLMFGAVNDNEFLYFRF